MLNADIIRASALAQGFEIKPCGGYWWVEHSRLATPLGILARHVGVRLPYPGGTHDPVFAWCAKQYGHWVVEAVMRGFEGYPKRAQYFCCANDEQRRQYDAAYEMARGMRE